MSIKIFNDISKKIINLLRKHSVTFTDCDQDNRNALFYLLVGFTENDEIEEFIENQTEDDSFPDNILSGSILFQDFFPENLRKAMLTKKRWDLSTVLINGKEISSDNEIKNILNGLYPEMKKIYSCFFPFSSTPSNGYDILMELFHNCLVILNTMAFKNQQTILTVRDRYFMAPPVSVTDFCTILKSHSKLLLEGMAGCGKTIFIKHFLRNIPVADTYYVSYSHSLQNTLSQIEFDNIPRESLTYRDIYQLLKTKTKSSLLVIDNMNPASGRLVEELKELSKLNLPIIVITHSIISHDTSFHKFSLPPYSDSNLMELYQRTSNSNESLSDETRDKLLSWTHRNALLISLLAYNEKKVPGTFNYLLDNENNAVGLTKELPKYKHPYDAQTQTLMGHAKKIYDMGLFKQQDKALRNYLKILCCFRNAAIPIWLLEKIVPEFHYKVLERLSEFGFLYITGNNDVQLPSLIADVIYEVEKPTFYELSETIEFLNTFLWNYEVKLDEYPLPDILLPFIERLQPTIILKNNPNQKSVSQNQEAWWSFVYGCIEYYQTLGNYDAAGEIIQLLEYPDKTNILYLRANTDKILFSTANAWLDNSTSFELEIDKAIQVFKKLLHSPKKDCSNILAYMPNIVMETYLTTIILDKILLRYTTQQQCFEQLNYGSIYKEFWNSESNIRIPFPLLKQQYYDNLYQLLFTPIEDITATFFLNAFFAALQYRNINLQLQFLTGIATRSFDVMEYNRGNQRCLAMLQFIKLILLPQLTLTIKPVFHLPKYTFELCFYTFLRYKKLELGSRPNIFSSQDDFQFLIDKCSSLSKSERDIFLLSIQD